jgi:hypothetical protein
MLTVGQLEEAEQPCRRMRMHARAEHDAGQQRTWALSWTKGVPKRTKRVKRDWSKWLYF